VTTSVIYHAACADGFCSAWLFKRAFPDAQFFAATHGSLPPAAVHDTHLYIVDFSYPRDVLLELSRNCKSILVLDHHETAREACEGLEFCQFDMRRSGAMMALDYLADKHPAVQAGREIVAYVQDRDLWRWELPSSREVNASIRSYPMTFEAWDELMALDVTALAAEGAAIERYRRILVEDHVRHACDITLAGHVGLGVACTAGEIISEVAGKLAESRPFGACWFDTADGYRVYSLRSREDGISVSEVAKTFGGGGHAHAAGFKMPR